MQQRERRGNIAVFQHWPVSRMVESTAASTRSRRNGVNGGGRLNSGYCSDGNHGLCTTGSCRDVRTPHELLWHMTGVIGYARTMLRGGAFEPPRLTSFAAEIERFHDTLRDLSHDLGDPLLQAHISDEQFLQGPLSDAMTHAGQLAMLRRMHGSPVPSENFIYAAIDPANVSTVQPEPMAPDRQWAPHLPPPVPGPTVKYTRPLPNEDL